ncbi:MAG: hypothetical protein E6J41_03515 [Chloroflexi bacterium]|nr:MAG: hypothetical protein E6J41_03515 [Chloroflexota bacterium]
MPIASVAAWPSAVTAEPVSVARSTMCVAPARIANVIASARTSRPSASVLRTSTVRPEALVHTSPGRWAAGPGMLSVAATTAMTSSGRRLAAITSIAASTAAAPPMSPRIRTIPSAVFSDRPPLSNVIPLPTSARLSPPRPPRCWSRIRRGGRSDPAATPDNSA